MTLSELLENLPSYDALREKWLVFDAAFCPALDAAQTPNAKHRVNPVALTDGRYAVCADLLSEIHPGGLFAAQFALLDPTNFSAVEVLDSIADLLPPPADT